MGGSMTASRRARQRRDKRAPWPLLEMAAKAAGYYYSKHGGYIVVDGIPG